MKTIFTILTIIMMTSVAQAQTYYRYTSPYGSAIIFIYGKKWGGYSYSNAPHDISWNDLKAMHLKNFGNIDALCRSPVYAVRKDCGGNGVAEEPSQAYWESLADENEKITRTPRAMPDLRKEFDDWFQSVSEKEGIKTAYQRLVNMCEATNQGHVFCEFYN